MLTLALAALIVLGAAVVKGTTAFGFTLIAAPPMLILMEPKLVPVVLAPLSLLLDATIIAQNWRRINVRAALPQVAAAVVATPLGTYVLLVIPDLALRLLISSVVLCFALFLLLGFTIRLRREGVARVLAGFLSGVLQTSTGMSGPPVALLNINQGLPKEQFRPAMSFFFVALLVVALVNYGVSGLLTSRVLWIDLLLLPGSVVGFLLALRLLPVIPQGVFRRLTILVIAASATLALVNALMAILKG
jgi:uncharacterized membrane protein YfcA